MPGKLARVVTTTRLMFLWLGNSTEALEALRRRGGWERETVPARSPAGHGTDPRGAARTGNPSAPGDAMAGVCTVTGTLCRGLSPGAASAFGRGNSPRGAAQPGSGL